jgi:hypothetical protein
MHMLLDRPDQPAPQVARSHSIATKISQDGPQVANSNLSTLASVAGIMDSEDKELDEARHAISRIPVEHPDWLHKSRAFASILSKRFEKTSQNIFLAECIDIQRQLCVVCPTENQDRAVFVSDLAFSLWTYFKQTGEEASLIESISLNREALSLRSGAHPDRSISCNNLALSLWIYFLQTGKQSLLTEAIDLGREALSLRPRGHPDRSLSCNSLAVSIQTLFDQTGEKSLVVEAISLHREALALRISSHPDRWKSCSNLANSLQTRFDQTCEESLLAEAIDLHREALALKHDQHPDRSGLCNNLARSLLRLFSQTGEGSLLAEVISLNREALSLRPDGHPERSMSCNNLACSLSMLYKQTGKESFVVEAIDLHREALSLRPSGHPDRHASCTNLAMLLCTLFKHTGEESLLSEAIDLNRNALSLHANGHPEKLQICANLATSLKTRFDLTGDESLLVEAINVCEETMNNQPRHHPGRWKPIANLVNIYIDRRFSQHNVVLAVDHLHQALSIVSYEWPILLSEIALLTSRIDLPTLPQEALSKLLQCFSASIDLASRVAGFILDPESQLRYLNSSQHLGPRAYWCAVESGQPQLGLELVEHARAMIWTQALHMRTSHFSDAPPELGRELEVLLSKMNTSRVFEAPMGLTPTEQDIRQKNGTRIHQLIQQIRAIPGQERFMRGLSFDELAQCANRNAVVVLIASEGRCHVLILQPHDLMPLTIELSGIKPHELVAMSAHASAARSSGSHSDDIHDNRMGMKAMVFESSSESLSYPVLEKLWKEVVKPVIEGLRLQVRSNYLDPSYIMTKLTCKQKSSGSSRPRLHWCPTGAFMSLPLHAAGIYDGTDIECCADYVVCSYTPTLTALLRAQKSNPSFHRHKANVGLLAVKQAWDVNLPTLKCVEDEINHITDAVERAGMSADNLKSCLGDTVASTRIAEVLETTNFVHIACHGKQNVVNALSSGFCLSDGNLSISQLMSLDLKDAFFAFLSACETAKGDTRQPDQIVHLAAAMLFVGFRSVVATMW